MRAFWTITCAFLIFGCDHRASKVEPNSFDLKLKAFFFNANIKAEYTDLKTHFKKIGGLNEFEPGWTEYPPLSALGQEKNKSEVDAFEFHEYLDQSAKIDSSTLLIRNTGPAKHAITTLEINLKFKLLSDADTFYHATIANLSPVGIITNGLDLEKVRAVVIHDKLTSSALTVQLFSDKQAGLYVVTLRLVVSKS